MIRHAILTAATLVSTVAFAGPTGLIFHAGNGFAAGASGPASADFTVERQFSNHTVLEPLTDISSTATQWFNIPLDLPVSDDAGRIRSVAVCFRTTGGAYISQTRLTEQLLPGSASIRFDDGTDRRDTVGSCYTVNTNDLLPGGVMTLRLRVAMPDASTDRIELTGGMVTMSRR